MEGLQFFDSWIDKKMMLLHRMSYFPEPYTPNEIK